MARENFGIERGLRIYDDNSDAYVDVLSGSGAPLGTSGKTAEASRGSLYTDRDTGALYKKTASTNAAGDWTEIAAGVTLDELSWRNEKVRFATGDTITAGAVNVLTLSDNDDMVYGDIAIGEYVIGDADGTPALFEVTALPGTPNITVAAAGQALADNDTFVVQQYLPDPSGQEEQAIIHFPLATGPGVKIGDINWEFATGISLSGGYAASAGTVTAGDSVEAAIQKLDGNDAAQDLVIAEIDQNVDDLISLSGVAENSTVLGAFAAVGNVLIGASETVKSALQLIFDLYAQLRGVELTGITTAAAVDSIPHASVTRAVWHYEAFEEATPVNREAGTIEYLTNGSSVDDTKYAKLKVGSNFDLTIGAVLNGANIELQASSSTAGVTVTARRIEVVKNVL